MKEDSKEAKDSTSEQAKASDIPGLPQEDITKAKEKKKKEEKRRRQKDNQKEKKGQSSQDQSLIMTPDMILSQEFDFQQCSDDSKDDPFEDSVESQVDLYALPETPKLFKSSFAKNLDILGTKLASPASTTRQKRGSGIGELSPIESAISKKVKSLKPSGRKSSLPLRK